MHVPFIIPHTTLCKAPHNSSRGALYSVLKKEKTKPCSYIPRVATMKRVVTIDSIIQGDHPCTEPGKLDVVLVPRSIWGDIFFFTLPRDAQ